MNSRPLKGWLCVSWLRTLDHHVPGSLVAPCFGLRSSVVGGQTPSARPSPPADHEDYQYVFFEFGWTSVWLIGDPGIFDAHPVFAVDPDCPVESCNVGLADTTIELYDCGFVDATFFVFTHGNKLFPCFSRAW